MTDNLPETTSKKTKFSLQNTFKTLKGKDKIEDVIEDFTSEVSLITEGLWNDQKDIRDQMNRIEMEQTLWENKEEDARETLAQEVHQVHKKITDLENEVKQLKEKSKKEKRSKNFLNQVSIMVFVLAGAWVLVTLIKAFTQMN